MGESGNGVIGENACLPWYARGTRASMEWLRVAACVGEDPEMFFPVGTAGPALREAEAAKRVCARCPVSAECLSYALGSGQTSGVWGGTGEQERVALLRTASHDATRRSTV
ncbi:WhiB family redox-sensing transcriptional regulator [Streptomyces achromogenes]|uniref:Transcriptional regulator WhiB n=1 Tax=Streptomyces achromogenes TaxID=67255 RepID=A0ABU0QD85_STRAH|nr:WhiB family transcriptional regulator [Streptomyces achromogenes]MDQ0687748.1 WhiB family redox-sensing transcriptional regulator [Streptomyces achromogenes]MDQ0834949.1 WhiB family redox-sensing transcriptional regulator [Streptomyces achromogenes]